MVATAWRMVWKEAARDPSVSSANTAELPARQQGHWVHSLASELRAGRRGLRCHLWDRVAMGPWALSSEPPPPPVQMTATMTFAPENCSVRLCT